MKKPINLKQLAKIAGISPSTVSRLLNDEYGVGSEKSEYVKKLAKEYGYKPNPIALGLKRQKSFLIGLIIPNMDDEFFSKIFAGIESISNETDYNILVTHANDSIEKEERLIRSLLDINVDGFLVSSAKLELTNNHFELIKEVNKPLVLFDRVNYDYPYSSVTIDNEKGGKIAAQHLIEKGCKNLCYVAFDKNYQNDQLRFNGFREMIDEHKMTVSHIVYSEKDTFSKELKKMKPFPDGFFCFNDRIAANVLSVIKDFDKSIPEGCKIVGFDNRYMTELTDPTLTTVSQHPFDMGKTAFSLLYDRLNGSETQKIILEPELIKRQST